MTYYDVFNGDADGICALHQLRLAEPLGSVLVSGLKRDIELLKRVRAQDGDTVTVLDVSLDRNRGPLKSMLERGIEVHYYDHHFAGAIPQVPNLKAVIDESPEVCTSMLVDRHLGGRFRAWAVVAAFGDNLHKAAVELAARAGIPTNRLDELRNLGASLNYNAYGESLSDVVVPPADLYRIVSRFNDPFALCHDEPLVSRLTNERRLDLRRALETRPLHSTAGAEAYLLPDAAWSRRVSGTFANRLAASDPGRAHAVLIPLRDGGYSVSVRSPADGLPAVDFCRRFIGGGGRRRAAGIDRLPAESLGPFIDAFGQAWTHETVTR